MSAPQSAVAGPGRRKARVIAFYLPQFHEVAENNEWWGKGFTEWTNVRAARPLFPGHRQPVVPGRLGYYDLTDSSTREAQASLAAENGIEGFCYWHYWFGNGKRILERPFEEVLKSQEPSLPFCLCWANHSWTGIWYGAPNRVLIEQTYPGDHDFEAHFRHILPALRDPRHLTVNGKPIFLVYAPKLLPDAFRFISQWRALALEAGLPGLHLVGMGNDISDTSLEGFDQIMQYGPGDYLEALPPYNPLQKAFRRFAASKFGQVLSDSKRASLHAPVRHDYRAVVDHAFKGAPDSPRYIPCILPGWDNTPRSGRRGVVFSDATPELFRQYLRKALARVATEEPDHRLVFVKAWNEWAEGNVLEPTQESGNAFLDVVREEILG
jgi:lipopolysaccharide biosynthesis protein